MKIISLLITGTFLTAGILNGQNLNSGSAVKKNYILNQGYLAKPGTSLGNPYGDSLKGFNEAAHIQAMASKGISSAEAAAHLNHLKREYIDTKYQLKVFTPSPYQNLGGGMSAGKKKGGPAIVNVAPCVNEGFELTPPGAYTSATAVSGWTVEQSASNGICPNTNWTAGSNEFSIVATPLTNWPFVGSPLGAIPHSPFGGTVVAQLNDNQSDYSMTRIRQTFPVTSANSLFQFAYAGYWQDGGTTHTCCDQPGIMLNMYDCSGNSLACNGMSISPACASAGITFSVHNGNYYTPWQAKFVDLTAYIGQCITVEFITTDCSFGGHWGTTLLDVRCGGQNISIGLPPPPGPQPQAPTPVSFCSGSNVAQIIAQGGYHSYQWFAPGPFGSSVPVPAVQGGTAAILSVNNPTPGTSYTVQMVSANHCTYTAINTISPSVVNIAGLSADPSCTGGASGQATVVGNGSGAGYTYTWTNSTNQVVGTQSIVSGLAPGNYTVTIAGSGSVSCGTASAAINVSTAPAPLQLLTKNYCGTEAYFQVPGATNIQWYTVNGPVTGSTGTSPNFTLTNASSHTKVFVSYLSNFGCTDTAEYLLSPMSPGQLSVPPANVSLICPAANNGTAMVNLVPTASTPTGSSYYKVNSMGTTAPYSASVGPTSASSYSLTGLSQGSYSVEAFDGACKYNTTFTVHAYIFDYNVTPATHTLCEGSNVAVGVNFTSNHNGAAFNYSWSPASWLVGGNGSLQNTILTPTGIPDGVTVNTTFSVTVTPKIINCPIQKTIQITAVDPPTPTITPVNPLCNTASPLQVQVLPANGVFSGISNQIMTSSGMITPTAAAIGTNTFMYTINVLGCSASAAESFQVSQFYPATLTSTISPLCVTSTPVNLMNIVLQTNGVWSGTGVQGTQFIPSSLSNGNYVITYSTQSSPNATVCPASSQLVVAVTSTSTPVITAVTPFCNNKSAFTMTASPAGGGWTGANISAGGVVTPSMIAQPGNHAVTYTVADGPCVNVASTSFNVSSFNSAAITGTLNELCYNSQPVNLMSIAGSTVNGMWEGLDITVTSNVLDPGGNGSNIPQTNVYTLVYKTTSFPDAALCPDSDTIRVAILNPAKPEIAPAGPLCSTGAPVQLKVSPSNMQGGWSVTEYLSKSGLFDPTMAGVGNIPVEFTSGKPNCNRKQTKFVKVEAFVPAALTTKKLPDLCDNGAPMNLTPYTANNTGGWQGSGIIGNIFNPKTAGQGMHVLTYSTASVPSGLCPDQSTIAVNVYSLATPNIEPVKPVCSNHKPLQLKADVLGGLYGGVNTRAVNLSGLFIPSSAEIGGNIVNYTITSGPCIAYTQSTINVEKFVEADLHSIPSSFCPNGEAVNMNHFAKNPGGLWSGDGIVSGSSMFDPSKANLGDNNLVTYYTFSSPTATLCPDKKEVRIRVVPLPPVTPVVQHANAKCAPHEVVFSAPNSNNSDAKVTWITGDGSSQLNGQTASHVYTRPGTYTVVMNFQLEGCSKQYQLNDPIRVSQTPTADFIVPEEVLISGPEVQIQNRSTPLTETTYTWMINGATVNAGEVNPIVSLPAELGKYELTLVASNHEGCKDEITKMIEVKSDFNVYIPTSFSPNYDNLNDVFKPEFSPYGLDLRTYEMEVYDRWGQLLFHTNDSRQGWNGTAGSRGEICKEGVYVYKIRFKDIEGNAHSRAGAVTLLK